MQTSIRQRTSTNQEQIACVAYGLWDSYDGAAGLPVWFGAPNGARDAAGHL